MDLQNIFGCLAVLFREPSVEIAERLDSLVAVLDEEIRLPAHCFSELKTFCAHTFVDEPVSRLGALWSEYIPLFVSGRPIEAAPYASLYLSPDGSLLGEETTRLRKVYSSFNYHFQPQGSLLLDHIAVELEFIYHLLNTGHFQPAEHFYHNHLAPFLVSWLPRVYASGRPFYGPLGQIIENLQQSLELENQLYLLSSKQGA